MPEVVIPLHELFVRHSEIPDVDDCYLVGIWNQTIPEGDTDAVDHGAFPEVPWRADKFDALVMAREGDEEGSDEEETWQYQWGWDGTVNGGQVRIGCNTPSVRHPVYLRFRWGEGVPGSRIDGIEMLPHVQSVYRDCKLFHCDFCATEMQSGRIADCHGRRLIALADAVRDGDSDRIKTHLRAVDLWHRETRSGRLERQFREDMAKRGQR